MSKKKTITGYERRVAFNGKQRDEVRLALSSTRWECVSVGLRGTSVSKPPEKSESPADEAGKR